MKSWFSGVAVACLAFTVAARAEPPPAAAFGRIPAVADVAMSPDGQHLALLGGAADERVVSVATLDKPEMPTLKLGPVEGVSLRWAGDHVLVRVAAWKALAPREAYRFERNLVVDMQARAVSTLLQHDPNSLWLVQQPVLGVSRDPERAYVVGLTISNGADSDIGTHIHQKSADHPFLVTLFSVDPATGAGVAVETGGYDTVGWGLDDHGAPLVRVDNDVPNRRINILRRSKAGGRYTPVWTAAYKDRLAYYGFAAAENAIYVAEQNQLQRVNLDTGAREPVGPALDHVHPSLLWDPAGHKVVGVATNGERREIQWLDPAVAAADATLSKAFKGRRVDLMDWSADGARFVVRVTSHDEPPAWYLYDKPRHELSPLGDEYPELKGAALGTTRTISFKARDGLEMIAYLTLPPGARTGERRPVVVLPHGGPAARDDDDFDFIVQFLATRGYAVLRPQFRGSWGFGQAFLDAGRGEWGGKMQTDLLDALDAAAASGDVDPSRACVVGASFGGYAAMAAAAFHSDRYRCAVSLAGISHLGLLLTEEGRIYGRDSGALDELRGDLSQAGGPKLEAASPALHAASVSIPLLLIHGDQDTVVPMEQSNRMVQAMEAAHRPVDFVVLKGENHYLVHGSTRTEALARIGDFLGKNLPVTP